MGKHWVIIKKKPIDEEEEDKKLIQEEKETDPKKEYKVGKNYEASSVLDLKLAKTPVLLCGNR